MAHSSLCQAAGVFVDKERPEDVESELSTEVGDSDGEQDDMYAATGNLKIPLDLLSMPFAPKETLIIFDWDDTLLPTTWIKQEGLLAATPTLEQAAQLQQLAERIITTLSAAKQRGKVVIITNALQGWVEQSCSLFMPSLLQYLQDVDVISARSSFEFEAEHTEWKCMAFAEQVTAFYERSVTQRRNVISLGDALYEQRALTAVTQCVPNCYAKSLKFLERPQVEQLIDEHDIVVASLQDVIDNYDNLDLEVSPEY
jgi:hypothetical protein